VQEGLEVPEGLMGRYLNQIHVEDCVGSIRWLLTIDHLPNRLIASDEQPSLRREVLGWLADQLARPLPTEGGDVPVGKRGQTHKQCSSQKLRDLGYQFAFPTYKEGYQQLLEDL